MIEKLVAGGWRLLRPDSREFQPLASGQNAPEYQWKDLEREHVEQGMEIDRNTAVTRWRGERMDYDLGVSVLCNQAERARHSGGARGVSAETSDWR